MKHELIHFEQKLAKEREVIVNELKGIGVHTEAKGKDDWEAIPGIEIDEADDNEIGDRISAYEGNTALTTELELRLKEIDLAQSKIQAGKFGICEVGGEPIEEDRLEANPAARTCKKHIEE
jgi:RNA polymerase-binding transcription factor DksA